MATAVALGNVRDVDAFVGAAIAADSQLRHLVGLEREELEAEGLAILCELHRDYEADRAGAWSFASYAGRYLAGRLRDAWHRLHRGEHVRRDSGRAGGRRYDFRTIASLDAERARPSFSEQGLRRLGEFTATAA